jgi:hypothetical protein
VAHAVVKKEYKAKRLVAVNTLIAHGTKKCVLKGLKRMGDFKINTSAVERSNLTNRSMNAYQVRKSAAFARSLESRHSLAWWVTTVLNFSRTSRVLRIKLELPIGRRLYLDRTPAMAAGIADHVWGTLELLRFVIPKMGDEIISRHHLILRPKLDGIGLFSFNREKDAIKAGFDVATQQLEHLRSMFK